MRKRRVLAKALRVERAVVLGLDERGGVFVLRVRVRRGDEWRCPVCRRKCGRYDSSGAVRRWRAHNFGVMRVEVESVTPRVRCAEHGVHMAYVPWARTRGRFIRSFEDMVTWLAVRTDRTTVTHLLLADSGADPRAGEQRGGGETPAAAGTPPDRHRRGQLPERPSLPDDRGRPRHREPDLGEGSEFFDESDTRALWQAVSRRLNPKGNPSRLLGEPFLHQDDPRFRLPNHVLLLQLDAFDKKRKLWGPGATFSLYVDPKGSAKGDFSALRAFVVR